MGLWKLFRRRGRKLDPTYHVRIEVNKGESRYVYTWQLLRSAKPVKHRDIASLDSQISAYVRFLSTDDQLPVGRFVANKAF